MGKPEWLGGLGPKDTDRRLTPSTWRRRALLCALLVAAFFWLYRNKRRDPPGMAQPMLAPPEPPLMRRSQVRQEPPPALTTRELMRILLYETPEPAKRKLVQAIFKQPKVRAALSQFKKTQGLDAPAEDFFRIILRLPEFQNSLRQLRKDPEVLEAFQGLRQHPKIASALRSATPRGRPAVAAAPQPRANAAAAPLAQPRDGPGVESSKRLDAHDVLTELKFDRSVVAKEIGGSLSKSMLTLMPRDIRLKMEEACEADDSFCEPVQACTANDSFYLACQDACLRSPRTCPRQLRESLLVGASPSIP